MKPRPLSKALEYMRPFVPLFLEHEQVLTEESRANKAWHLGTKEFVAYSTLGGHQPEPLSGATPQGRLLHNAPQ